MYKSEDIEHTLQMCEDISGISRRKFLQKTAVLSSGILLTISGLSVLEGCSRDTQRLDALHKVLAQEMDKKTALLIFNRIKIHYAELDSRKPNYPKWGMRFNLGNAILALAIYRTLCENNYNREASIERAGKLVWATMPVWLFKKVFWIIGQFPDPFAAFVWFTKKQCKFMFPSPGWERTFIETDNCFGIDVTNCFYINYLTKEGAPELVIAMCDLDYRTAELFPPQFYFSRAHCLAKGDKLCDFRYYRRKMITIYDNQL